MPILFPRSLCPGQTRLRRVAWLLLLVAARAGAADITDPHLPADLATIRRISLTEALATLDRENLELTLARRAVEAAAGRSTDARQWPNPEVALDREQLSGDDPAQPQTSISFSQPVELAGKRQHRQAAAAAGLTATAARAEALRLQLRFEIVRAFALASAAEGRLAARDQTAGVIRRVESAGAARLAEGDLSRLAYERLRLERARYEAALVAASLDVAAAARALALAVSGSDAPGLLLPATERPEAVPEPPTLSNIAEASARAEHRHEIAELTAQMAEAEAALALERARRVPDLALRVGFKDQADGTSGPTFGVSLPLSLWNRNQGRIAEAAALVEAARDRRALALRRARAEIAGAWETAAARAAQLAALAPSLAAANTLLPTAVISYEEGEASLVELLDAATAYLSAREQALDLAAANTIARADLERATALASDSPQE